MGRRLIIATSLTLMLGAGTVQVFSQPQATTMKVFSRSPGGELTAEREDRPDWCQPDMTFTIRGPDDRFFKEGETDQQGRQARFALQKLLGGIRIGLEKTCPQAKSVTLNGFVDDVFIYRGYAEKGGAQGDWVLIELPVNLVRAQDPPPPPAPAQASPEVKTLPPPRLAAIGECDALAAHPDDPAKPKKIKGVADDDLKAGEASEKCEEALEVEPDNPRIRYQLARAYLIYGKAAEGLELMTEAAEEGHAAAIASLGDVALYGLLDDEPDPETAKALYLRAAKEGFKPAQKLAEAIQANPKEDKSQEVIPEPEFIHPSRAQTMLAGETLPGNGAEFMTTLVYSASFVGGIAHHCEDAGLEISEQQTMRLVMNRMGAMQGGFALMAVGEGRYSGVQQEGMDDGYALAVSKGCKSKEVHAAHDTLRKTFY